MSPYTEEDITALIQCPKCVVQPPKREMKSNRGSLRNEMELKAAKGLDRFSVFMRVSEHFREDFSIGLKYHSPDGQSFNLIRCNGPHGEHLDIRREPGAHFSYHIHKISAEDINDGNFAERHGATTDGYASYEEALVYFLKTVGVIDAEKYFPAHASQPALFMVEGD